MPVKQLTKSQSVEQLKKFKTDLKQLNDADFKPGNLLIYRYDAKYKEQIYDKRPMIIVLSANKSHVLGLNFHWIPFKMRMWLTSYILRLNKKNIKAGKRIDFPYRKVKPLLKKLKFAPCIRLYIKEGISKRGIKIPPLRIVEAAQLRMEMFTGVPEEKIWQIAHRKNR